MQENGIQKHEDYCLYAGNLEEEINALLAEPDSEAITSNTEVLTIICC